MLEQLRDDVLASFLLQNSNLTEAQFDTILSSSQEGTLDSKRVLREKGVVSKGAFARTLSQARKNVESGVCTLLLLAYADLLSPEKVAQLARTTKVLAQLRTAKTSKDDLGRVTAAVEEFVQGFWQKGKVIL